MRSTPSTRGCVRCVTRHSLRSYPAPPQVLQRTSPTPPHARHWPAGVDCTPKKSALASFSSRGLSCRRLSTPVPSQTTQRTPPYPPHLEHARASPLVPTATAASSAAAAVPATSTSCVPTALHLALRFFACAMDVHVRCFKHVFIVVACLVATRTHTHHRPRVSPRVPPLHQWARRNNLSDQSKRGTAGVDQ